MPHVRCRTLISLRAPLPAVREQLTDTLGLTPTDDADPDDGPLCGAALASESLELCADCAPTGDGGTDVVIEAGSGLSVPYFGWFVTAITWIAAKLALRDAVGPAAGGRRGNRDAGPGPPPPPPAAGGVHGRGGGTPRRPRRGGGPGELLRRAADPELGRGDPCVPQVRPGPRARTRHRPGRGARLARRQPAVGPFGAAPPDSRVTHRRVCRERGGGASLRASRCSPRRSCSLARS